MNYNISNSNGSAQFLSLKPQNKLTEGQIVLQRTILFKISHFNSFKT